MNICCECVNARTGTIKTQGGNKDVLILELVDDCGEIYIKFFGANRTKKGNLCVNKNSDFARLYRLSTGRNQVSRFSRCSELLCHLINYQFVISWVDSVGAKGKKYKKVATIAPQDPVITDGWTLTGHLRRNVRAGLKKPEGIQSKTLAKHNKILNSNMASDLDTTGLEGDLNPIQDPLSKTGAFIPSNTVGIKYIERPSTPRNRPPQPPPEALTFDPDFEQKYLM